MTKGQPQQTFNPSQAIKKFLLSGFVVFTFIAYVIHQRLTNPDAAFSAGAAAPTAAGIPPSNNLPFTSTGNSTASQTSYRDGTYKGPEIDAFYGLVQVQATVQNGKIADVRFLEYPNDRRTSVQINSIAMPYLQQEAVQAQSANVDIISGATLTSEGFIMSLQSALASAKN